MEVLKYLGFVVLLVDLSLAEKNVLFLAADDLGTHLNPYAGPNFPSGGHPEMFTPNLDALAGRSLLLERAYVQYALCSPSRASLMTGRRPDATRVYNLQDYWRDVGGDFTTIPQYFKDHGYHTLGAGKIYHAGDASNRDDPPSWTDYDSYFRPGGNWNVNVSWMALSEEQVEETPLPDDLTADFAIERLHELAEKPDEPFFLAVGFKKPHLPFVFPERFLDYYPEEDIQTPTNPYAPVDMPRVHWINSGELRNGYEDIKKLNTTGDLNTTLPDETTLELRRAYYSTISYVDSKIGEVIDTLEELGLSDNTIIAFWSDHGFQTGEHSIWCKHTNFELALHTPLMIHIPGLTDEGIKTEHLVEFVDLFPTLVEAAELPELPLCPEDSSDIDVCTEGTSLMPLINDPEDANWKQEVFSQYYRWDTWMGYTMRTSQYRYTEWVSFTPAPDYEIDWDNDNGRELYNHENDPGETYNLANLEEYEEIVEELSKKLRDGWREAQPGNVGRVMNHAGKNHGKWEEQKTHVQSNEQDLAYISAMNNYDHRFPRP